MRNAYHAFLHDNKGQGLSMAELGARFRALPTHMRKPQTSRSEKQIQKHKRERIRVWWPGEQKWFWGAIAPTTATGRNHIIYDDGQRCYVYLPHETWDKGPEEGEVEANVDRRLSRSDATTNGGASDRTTVDTRDREAAATALIMQAGCETNLLSDVNVVVQIIRRNQMSCARLIELVRSMMHNKNQTEVCEFFTALCDDRHAISTHVLSELLRYYSISRSTVVVAERVAVPGGAD